MASRLIPGGARPIPGSGSFGPAPARVPRTGDLGRAPAGTRVRSVQGRFVRGGFGWSWEGLDRVLDLPNELDRHVTEAVDEAMAALRQEMEDYAKENAPWQDVTGDARAGLKGVLVSDERSGRYTIFLGHSVSYGVFLETRDGGATAIIQPTVQHFAPLMMGEIGGRL